MTRIAIAGAGIGGLTVALSLHAKRFSDVKVLGAVPEIQPLGVGINLCRVPPRRCTSSGLEGEGLRGRAPSGSHQRCIDVPQRRPQPGARHRPSPRNVEPEDRIEDLITPGELEDVAANYRAMAGFQKRTAWSWLCFTQASIRLALRCASVSSGGRAGPSASSSTRSRSRVRWS